MIFLKFNLLGTKKPYFTVIEFNYLPKTFVVILVKKEWGVEEVDACVYKYVALKLLFEVIRFEFKSFLPVEVLWKLVRYL